MSHTSISWKAMVCLMAVLLIGPISQAGAVTVHHDLQIHLYPRENKLAGVDRIRIEKGSIPPLQFALSEKVAVHRVEIDKEQVSFSHVGGTLRVSPGDREARDSVTVSIHYDGIFDDPVPIRPANTDDPGYGVTGTISERGTFLEAGSGWYPEMAAAGLSFDLRVEAPEGIIAVTAGRSLGQETKDGKTVSVWHVEHVLEGLSLSAGNYVIEARERGAIRIATYFFPESRHLAKTYLEWSEKYISLYQNLFGPYPFSKFAVVENFLPTGYGFPSYTLLGSRVLRLPFIVHTSLGHEIAHCWWGNGVYVDIDKGNWCEGLVTYVADYYYKEMASEEDARQYRLEILRKYTTLVKPEEDFPLKDFRSRNSPASEAIGYGKGAMVFHMLRKILGEEVFWGTLKDVYRNHLFHEISWEDFQKAFELRGRRSLAQFFSQWISWKGAPELSLNQVYAKPSGKAFRVGGELVQSPPFYELYLPLSVRCTGKGIMEKVLFSGKSRAFEISCDGRPEDLVVDPDFNVFRWLYPSEIPPSVDSLKGARTVTVILTTGISPELKEAADILMESFGLSDYRYVDEQAAWNRDMAGQDILFLGLPEDRRLLDKLPEEIVLQKGGFDIRGTLYDRPGDVLFAVFPHPFSEDHVAALFFPLDPRNAKSVAAKITHYGKYGYLVFRGGENRVKGIWPIRTSPLMVRFDNDLNPVRKGG